MVSYKNRNNNEIKRKLNQNNESKNNHEERTDAAPHQFDAVSPLESDKMHNQNIHGGSAYVFSSVQDL